MFVSFVVFLQTIRMPNVGHSDCPEIDFRQVDPSNVYERLKEEPGNL